MNTKFEEKDIEHSRAQLSAIQELLVNDHYLFLNPELKIISFSKNCILFSEKILKSRIASNIYLPQLLINIEEDLSTLKIQDFLLNHARSEIVNFKFQIGREHILMTIRRLEYNNVLIGYSCILECHTPKDEISEIFESMHLVANLSWFTSYKLRGPLSTIMSLINQNLLQEIVDSEQVATLFKQMKHQAIKLDEALHTLNKLLSTKEESPVVTRLLTYDLKNILMLDDDPVSHKIANKLIAEINAEISLFSFIDGHEAIEFLHTFPTDLILLDLNMTEITGWEFLDLMQLKGLRIPTVIVSSSIDTQDINRSFTYSNVKGFINKPIKKADLRMILENSLQSLDC